MSADFTVGFAKPSATPDSTAVYRRVKTVAAEGLRFQIPALCRFGVEGRVVRGAKGCVLWQNPRVHFCLFCDFRGLCRAGVPRLGAAGGVRRTIFCVSVGGTALAAWYDE